jgi:hypothetical protein
MFVAVMHRIGIGVWARFMSITEHSMEEPEKSFDQPQSERIEFINWIKRYQILFQILILLYFAVIS